ncbi:reverse transcriptase domain-containing protein [Tanacetum coccineum]
MSTRSTSSNLLSLIKDPESLIRRRNLGEPSSLFDFEEVMSIPRNNQGPPPAGPPPPNNNVPPPVVRPNGPAPDLRSMEELCQPSINGRGGPIAPIPIQATDFGLRHHMIQQVQNSCQFHGLPGDDANRHIDKFLEVTQHMKQNGVSNDALRLSLFPYSLTHHATAWYDRLPRNSIHSFNDMIRKFLSKYFPPSMIDTFYNGLTLRHQDTINVAAGGTFMQKTPKECYDLIENMTAHHNHWDTLTIRDETSRTISSTTTTTESLTVVRQLEMMNKNFQDIMKQIQSVKSVSLKCETCGGPPSFIECPAVGSYNQEAAYATTVRLLPEVVFLLMDLRFHLLLLLFRRKWNENQRLHFDISFVDALLHMPKFASTFKSLLSNKEKLFELANTPLNKNCSAVLLKKLPEKLGDPDKFLIPCDFPELDECLALADLGASINLMPLFVWKKLSLPELTPTRMTLELTNRLVAYPVGVAEDVFIKVGKFYFPAEFVVVDYDVDLRVPLILGRPFLRTARALIDVHGEELTLRFNDEAITFKFDGVAIPLLGYIIRFFSARFTPFEGGDFILEEIETFLHTPDELSNLDDDYYDTEGDILYLEKLLNEDPSSNLPPMKNKDLKQVDVTMTKPLIKEPLELELKDLPSHLEYEF